MTTVNILLFFVFALTIPSEGFLDEDCKSIVAEVHTQVSDNSEGVVAVVNLIKGDRGTVKYIFCSAKDGKVLNEGDFKRNEIRGLGKGKYLCIVSTKDCTKKIEFTIE